VQTCITLADEALVLSANRVRNGYAGRVNYDRESRCFIVAKTRLNYLDIKTVVVSCGTCAGSIAKNESPERKFSCGCRLLGSTMSFCSKVEVAAPVVGRDRYSLHVSRSACHSPMKTAINCPCVVEFQLMGQTTQNERCWVANPARWRRTRPADILCTQSPTQQRGNK
jgi:hypothetical protein